ncbi:MAG: hypothetical protein WCG90_03875 [Chitinophagia bacterium]
MAKTKKLDIFNLFYSGAAVVILIGVIAKLLEWPAQDLLITGGLAIEAVVFGASAIKFVEVKKEDQVATEATLSKVADGLGNLKGNSDGVGGSGFSTNYDYEQTDKFKRQNNVILNLPPNNYNIDNQSSINTSHTIWQLEQLDILRLEQLIQKVDYTNENELSSLINLLQTQSDDLKSKLWSRFKKIKFNVVTNSGYDFLKLLVQSTISFSNSNHGAQIFKNLIEFQVAENKFIVLNDVINYSAETIYFGPQNEYSIHLNELFSNNELENLSYINTIIDQLVLDNVAPKYKLIQLFGLSEFNSKKEVFDKLNYQFSKTNSKPNRAQLLFVLLYKQYSNS